MTTSMVQVLLWGKAPLDALSSAPWARSCRGRSPTLSMVHSPDIMGEKQSSSDILRFDSRRLFSSLS